MQKNNFSGIRGGENGNVFFIILIAVVLFAALSYTVARGLNSGSTSNLSKRQTELAASEILEYAQRVSRAVDRVRRKGCSESDLSFQHDEDGDGDYNDADESYYNANAPSDFTCHIFHPAGGNLKWSTPNTDFLDTSKDGYGAYGQYFIPNLIQVVGVGTTCVTAICTELILDLPYIKLDICDAINKKLNTNTVSDGITNHSYIAANKFIGSFTFVTSGQTSTIGDGTGPNILPSGQTSGCISRAGWGAGGSPYAFYHVLLAR